MTTSLAKLLANLNLPESAIRVYERLLETGSASASQLAAGLGVARTSMYQSVQPLLEQGLIIEDIMEGKKIYRLDTAQNLTRLVDEKISLLQKERKGAEKTLATLHHNVSVQPRIKMYPGIDGVKQVLNELVWSGEKETFALWPLKEMLHVLGTEYFENFHRKRIRNGITARVIWPETQKVDLRQYPFIGIGDAHLKKVHIAPKGMHWDMGSAVYGDKVGFISSHKEAFGFTIQSRDFANLMRTQFEVMWKISKPTKPEYSEAFLKTV